MDRAYPNVESCTTWVIVNAATSPLVIIGGFDSDLLWHEPVGRRKGHERRRDGHLGISNDHDTNICLHKERTVEDAREGDEIAPETTTCIQIPRATAAIRLRDVERR